MFAPRTPSQTTGHAVRLWILYASLLSVISWEMTFHVHGHSLSHSHNRDPPMEDVRTSSTSSRWTSGIMTKRVSRYPAGDK